MQDMGINITNQSNLPIVSLTAIYLLSKAVIIISGIGFTCKYRVFRWFERIT